jgi:hypothetical protein
MGKRFLVESPLSILCLSNVRAYRQFSTQERESEGSESFLYQVDDHLWHYVPEDEFAEESNPYPVQNLVLLESSEA